MQVTLEDLRSISRFATEVVSELFEAHDAADKFDKSRDEEHAKRFLYFAPQREFPDIHPEVGYDEAVEARATLLEVIEDFPLVSDAHRAAWLASVLTPLAVHSYHGPEPLFLVDANVPGTGKGLLTAVTSEISSGREISVTSLPRNDDEFRKRITAIALAGEPLVLLDNVAGSLGTASFDAALTATSWSDRVLGESTMTGRLPLRTVWYATANNVVLSGDIARRLLHIRLESQQEKPEMRDGFKHPDLLAYVRENREQFTAAALTILRAYVNNGRPKMKIPPWGSFDAWSRIVRHAVVWCGMPDPAETRIKLAERADTDANTLARMLDGWEEIDEAGDGLSVAQMLKKLQESVGRFQTLRDVLAEFPAAKDGKLPTNRSIGMKLHHWQRRVCGGRYFDSSKDNSKTTVWTVVRN